jgi:hypothetical protein
MTAPFLFALDGGKYAPMAKACTVSVDTSAPCFGSNGHADWQVEFIER